MSSSYIRYPASQGVSSLNNETGAVTLVPGTGITITPAGQNITIASTGEPAITFADSIVNTANVVTLVGDSASPTNNSYYGKSGLGTLGYYVSPLINVKVYGVKGDNSTDDTVALQTLINATALTAADGFTLFFPQGRYILSNITIPAECCLVGEGVNMTEFVGKAGSTGYMLTDQGNAAKIEIKDIGFFANSQSYTAVIRLGYGATQWGTSGCIISDVNVRDCPSGVGVDLDANVGICRNLQVGNCDICIRVLGNGNYFSDCSVSGFQTYGVYASDSFWEGLEVEAPNVAGSICFYMFRQCKITDVVISLGGAITFTNVFFADAGASHCTITNLVYYTQGGAAYTNLIGGTTAAVNLQVASIVAPTANSIPVYSNIDPQTGLLFISSPMTVSAGNVTASGTLAASNLSGTNSGDMTLTAVGSSPSANGASLSTQALTLQPADGTHPGLITSGIQTIGGAKTFSSTIGASNFSGTSSGTNTGDQTITLTGNVTGSGTGSFATTIATGVTLTRPVITGVTDGTTSSGAGNVGEYLLSQVTSNTNVGGASATYWDATSLSLTAGCWDLVGTIQYAANGGTLLGGIEAGINITTGNSNTGEVDTLNWAQSSALPNSTENQTISTPIYRVSPTTTTIYYLKGLINYTVGTPQYKCTLRALRVR